MIKLGVNIDHVATLREARKTVEPDPVRAAIECVEAGCDSIVCHLRKDRRHIQDEDLFMIKRAINAPLNMEMSVDSEIVDIACLLRPQQATIVPENRREITTEGGLDVACNLKKIREVAGRLKDSGIRASLFIDPELKQLEASVSAGVKMVEFHTGRYAEGFLTGMAAEKELEEIKNMTARALEMGLIVAAGHGLTYGNVAAVAHISGIYELNIGHSIISNSVFWGIKEAVRRMKELIS
ncbi:MAG TPA: pyridoxine 5'-phosphate synthase [Candidatus Omnitrophota bacterium]|nr:pyridoxine 5'-phosphate synthase [Candidatus Omnitrophota bacterium]